MTENIQLISAPEITPLLQSVCREKERYYQTALSNVATLKSFFAKQKSSSAKESGYVIVRFAKGDVIVDLGKISNPFLQKSSKFSYAYVPLGFIVSGTVNVLKGGKGTKKLTEGDFIGLFETSDALLTHRSRNIGDWVLIADEPTSILFFSEFVLSKSDRANNNLREYLIELARADTVPQPITTLPLLDWVASHTTRSRLADYVIVAHTHFLPNNLPFFRHLAYLVGFGRMYVLEKPYSTVRATYNELIQSGCEVIPVHMEPGVAYEFSVQKSIDVLWSKVIQEQKNDLHNLLIIDDGGDLWTSLPWEKLHSVSVTGVEQTQRGISRIKGSKLRIPPIVSVASSGIKKLVESRFIAKSIVQKMQEHKVLTSTTKVGVIGFGGIGKATHELLENLGHTVMYYDPESKTNGRRSVGSLDALLNASDVVIGTTGTDALKGIALERVHGEKILVSASSADVEFASLLKLAAPTKMPFGKRSVKAHARLTLEILNGGYPLNFDRKKDATPSEDIVLTRCLMYVAAMQAVALHEPGTPEGKVYGLDIVSQKKILERWISERKNSGVSKNDIDRIVQHTDAVGEKSATTVWSDA